MVDRSRSPLVLGIDLGTSAVKAVVLDCAAVIQASATASFTEFNADTSQSEQDPADWLSAASTAITSIDRALQPRTPDWRGRVAAVGLTGQLPTLVCLNRDGPLGRAITWKDGRADQWAATALDAPQRRTIYEHTGMPIDGRYLGPMFRFHRHHERDAVEFILSAKDYLCYALTGRRVTDPSTAAGYGAFDLTRGEFSQALCELWNLPLSFLPAVQPAHSAAGPLSAQGARILGLPSGIPVTVGAADSVATAYAMAGLESGIICVTMGSSTVIIDALRERRVDPAARYLLTPHVSPEWYGREMDLLATGSGYRWLSGLFGWADGTLDQHAARSVPGARGLTFHPYLAGGEQGALWNPALRGAVLGLTLQHAAGDIARAFLEGVCFEIRRCVDVLTESATVREVIVAGHLIEHPSSLQMLADILQQPVRAFGLGAAAALGAAAGALSLIDPMRPALRASPASPPAMVQPGPASMDYRALGAAYLSRTIDAPRAL